jgi:hypothetical protein
MGELLCVLMYILLRYHKYFFIGCMGNYYRQEFGLIMERDVLILLSGELKCEREENYVYYCLLGKIIGAITFLIIV